MKNSDHPSIRQVSGDVQPICMRYSLSTAMVSLLLSESTDERDGCVAGCPECIWGGEFPAKDCCEGYEPPDLPGLKG